MSETALTYADTQEATGYTIEYLPQREGGARLRATAAGGSAEASFSAQRIDEAHILYMEATELLSSRAKAGDVSGVKPDLERLFALFRGERVSFEQVVRAPKRGEFVPNPGKKLDIMVNGVSYVRLPVKTRLITMQDTDIVPLIREYVSPYVRPGDMVFVSEKALTITQGRVVDMGTVVPSRLARTLARNVGNYYGSGNFRGFGHGTAIAMQLFIEEAGYARVVFAALLSAFTRPLGIRGLFYRVCGKRAKSIDCPMSFLILEYAHSVKLAPQDPSDAARRIKQELGGNEVVILDANYRGAFSLGKSSRAISESFIGELFRDNPLGQSDEMTPFCIVRKA
jgi:hypothetical protein